MLHRRRDASARAPRAGQLDHERHPDGFVVEEDAVLVLAVIAEAFAVIGEKDDRRGVVEAFRSQKPEQLAEVLVGVLDLAVVGAGGGEFGRGRIRRVRLVGVDEQKELRRRLTSEPADRVQHRGLARPLQLAERHVGGGGRQLIVERVEAAVESDLPAEHVRRHEAGGCVAGVLEAVLQELLIFPDGEPDVVAHAVFERQLPGQDRRVRRQRLRRVRVRTLEQHAVSDEAIDVGGRDFLIAVRRQPVRAQGVDRDQDDRAVPGLARGISTRNPRQGRAAARSRRPVA